MAFFRGVIYSSTLNIDTGLCVIMPHDRPKGGNPVKALYLLHGYGNNCEAWTRYTSIGRYARKYGVAVIMPEVQNSFYLNMRHGPKYFDYVAKELPGLCSKMFGISPERDDTFIAGISMGGYGALKCGLTYPERYAGCAGFSGVADIEIVIKDYLDDTNRAELQGGFGIELEVADGDNLFKLAEGFAALPPDKRADIFITCGTEDFLYRSNAAFSANLEKLGIAHKYMEWPGGHEWEFWDKSIQYALERWFPDTPQKD